MIIKRKLFSKSSKEEKDPEKSRKKARNVGLGIAGGAFAAQQAIGVPMVKHMQGAATEEEARVAEKVLDRVKKTGTKVGGHSKMGPAYDMVNDRLLDSGSKRADILAHEAGHAAYTKNVNGAGKLGRAAHKAYKYTGGALNHMVLSPAAGIAAGYASGKDAVKKEEEGKKQGKLARHAGTIASMGVQSPALVAEAAASHRGLKLMKEAGASKKLMKAGRKNLALAGATYAGQALINVGVSEAARAHAIKEARRNNEIKKEQEKRKNSKK